MIAKVRQFITHTPDCGDKAYFEAVMRDFVEKKEQ